MIVRENDRQLSFQFHESDPYFEIGYKIMEQEKLSQMLPYERVKHNNREKLVFSIEDNIEQISKVLPLMSDDEVVDLLYEVFYMTMNIEENGFLKKECIWFKYDNVYYDLENKRPRVAILPISREFRYADGFSWYGQFEETVMNIANQLPHDKADHIDKLVRMLRCDKLTCEEVLEEIDGLGNGKSGVLFKKPKVSEIELQLIYSGKKGRIEFNISKDGYVIGKNPEFSDGIVPESISRAVSRRHCMVTKLNSKYFIQDLDSSNHTLVNGIMIPAYELMELANSDILSVADVEFRVRLREVG